MRVCEAALLLASLCSSMEHPPVATMAVSDDGASLQTYLSEKAVQDTCIKQHQYWQKPVATVRISILLPYDFYFTTIGAVNNIYLTVTASNTHFTYCSIPVKQKKGGPVWIQIC